MNSPDLPTCSKFVKSKSVNSKIIDYYLKYGKDRDIEKFMRFNNSSGSSYCPCPSKSSSGSDDNNLVSEELILAFQPCENKCEVVSDPNKENSSRDANKTSPGARTPTKTTGPIFHVPDSVTKIAKKLEWDSLGDVGYKKANSTGNLSSLERSVLKELFSESPSVPNIPQQRSDEIKFSSNYSLSAETRREKWRQTLENLGKKYSSRSGSHNTQDFMELPQSTPKVVPNTDKSCQTTFEKAKPLVKTRTNHSCQTSFDRSKIPDSTCQLKSQETQANLSSRAESFATQSSFEYHAGERRESESSSKSSIRRSILSEKNDKSQSTSKSVNEKQLTRRTNHPKTEVELGIKLLCSLIDAKNLTGTQKKNLAKEIFQKITKQHSTGAGGGGGESMTSSSVSSAFSVRSLIECSPLCEDQKQIATQSTENKIIIEQMTEESQTEEPPKLKEDENRPQSSPSLEEPVTMREWLHPLTRSEKDYEKKLKQKPQGNSSSHVSERTKQLSWIEMEINRLEGLKNLILQECPSKSRSLSSSSTIKSSKGRSEIIYEETSEDIVHEEDQYKSSMRMTSQNVVIYDEPTADKHQKQMNSEKVEHKAMKEDHSASSSGSLQKNHRSKLETPSSSPSTERESIGAFADQLQKQFMDNYSKKKHTTSAGHYSEPRNCGKPIITRNPSYTSVASSAFCMSSEMSIPIVESTSTSTTTHQYDSNGCDSIEGVAIQTSYSVIKSDPIFGPRCRCICTCGKECKCSCPRPTVRVSGKAFHQTVQVKPKALAYVIRFDKTSDDQGNKLTEDGVSLQKRLEMKNPDFCSKANERREILKKLHVLRQEREEKIREIADSSSVSSISRKLGELPPPPIKQVRICPSREMKGMTMKRYSKLPEVVAKQEREKLERRKKTTRVITNIFNKKLQRMVHKGKLSLENSRTVI